MPKFLVSVTTPDGKVHEEVIDCKSIQSALTAHSLIGPNFFPMSGGNRKEYAKERNYDFNVTNYVEPKVEVDVNPKPKEEPKVPVPVVPLIKK